MGREERLKEMDPRVDGNYVLFASRRDKCIVCNKCVEVCPVDAIKIEAPTVERAKQVVKGKQWDA
jgi:formate hydrogenlyase subunit 6/NADH:ubiquinone oxidoreductase subunit I